MKMNLEELKENMEESVLWSMREYLILDEDDEMEGFVPSYKKKDVDTCKGILIGFLDKLALAGDDREKIMVEVKEVVRALNVLNEKCERGLIGTEQREDIRGFVVSAVNVAGWETGEDVTAEWREW